MTTEYLFDLNEQNLQSTLQLSMEKPLVISCWASQIPDSVTTNALLEKLANQYQGAFILAQLNCEKEQNIAMQLGVQNLPTVAVFQQGRPVDGIAGAQTEDKLKELLGKYLPSADELALQQAEKLIEEEKYTDALLLLRPLGSQQADNGQYQLRMAQCLLATNEFSEAQAFLDKVTLKDQDSLYQSLKAKLELHQQAADTPEIRSLEAAHQTQPEDIAISYQLALQYSQVERNEEALALLLQILEKDLNFADGAAKKSMLDILSSLGQTSTIASHYRRKMYRLLY